ncbi:MAG: hypothetical protein WDM88_00745 [Galbitalea sp.]
MGQSAIPNIEVDLYSGELRVRGAAQSDLGNIKEYVAEAITPKDLDEMMADEAGKLAARDLTDFLEGKPLPPDDPVRELPPIIDPDE